MSAAGGAVPAGVYGDLSMLVTALWFEIDHRNGSAASGFFTPDAS